MAWKYSGRTCFRHVKVCEYAVDRLRGLPRGLKNSNHRCREDREVLCGQPRHHLKVILNEKAYCCWFRWSQTNLASQQKLSFTKTHQVHTGTFQQVKMQIGLIFYRNIEGARDASGAGDWKGARHKDWRHSCRRQVDFKLKRILRWTIEHIITFPF